MEISYSPSIYHHYPNRVRGALVFALITGLALIALGSYAIHTGAIPAFKATLLFGILVTIMALFLLFILKRKSEDFFYYVENGTLRLAPHGSGRFSSIFDPHQKNLLERLKFEIKHGTPALKDYLSEIEEEIALNNGTETEAMARVLGRYKQPLSWENFKTKLTG